MNHAPPRSAMPSCSSLGSPTMAASWVSSPRSHSTFVPWMPASSSSAARWNTSCPAIVVPARRSAAAAASAAAIGPFMSALPRPTRRPSSSISPAHGSCRQVSGEPAGTTSRWPFQARLGPAAGTDRGDDARAPGVGAHDLGLGAEVRQDVGGDGRRVVLGAAGILALGCDERAGEARAPRRARRPPRRRRARPSSTMARDATCRRARLARRGARGRAIAHARPWRSPRRRARADRARARAVADLHGAGRRALAPCRGDLVPGGLADPGEPLRRDRAAGGARGDRRSTRRCRACSVRCPRCTRS